MKPLKSINILVTGFYFKNIDFYKKLRDEAIVNNSIDLRFFILSHKKETEIDNTVLNYLTDNNWQIIYKENIGWDWGCHVQFMQWLSQQQGKKPDYILFLHDDIKIVQNGFIKAFLKKIEEGFQLIGNSSPFTEIKNFERSYPEEAFILENHNIICLY